MTTTPPSKRRRPRRDELKPGECLCDHCTGQCCRYFSLPIDNPTTWNDYDSIRWYLAHGRTMIYVEKGQWYLLVMTRCKYLTTATAAASISTAPRSVVNTRPITASMTASPRSKSLRDARADLGVCRGRIAPRRGRRLGRRRRCRS